MTAPTGLTHIEQAKEHIREALQINKELPPNANTRLANQLLAYALDEIIRHVEHHGNGQHTTLLGVTGF